MAPLIFLLLTFGVLYAISRLVFKNLLTLSLIGRMSMAVMLIVTGVAHFTNADFMIEMMPEFVPMKREVVYFTGICELLAVFGLIWNKTSKLTSVALMIFFIAILPANIIGSLKNVPLGGMDYGALYLLFRIPLQILFILWVYYFGIRVNKS
jgi:uncharacterized membrane protein